MACWPEGGGDPHRGNKPSSPATFFGQRSAEFARAMRAASPTPLTLYIALDDWALGYRKEAGIKAIIREAGDDVDGFGLHFYPNNNYFGNTNADLLGRIDPDPSNPPEGLAGSIDLARRWA